MSVDQLITHWASRGDPAALGVQFLALFGDTLLLIYSVVLTTRSFTYVRSHAWVLFEAAVATLICFGVFRIYVMMGLKSWGWLLPLCLFASVLDFVMFQVDGGRITNDGRMIIGGRSLIDVNAEKKSFLETNYRLVRRAAMCALTDEPKDWSPCGRDRYR